MDDNNNSNICLVCGDKAIGTNFSVKTCESCKVFFRRNALNFSKFECQFDNDCKIDVLRRKFCKKCRIKKCLSVGMKKEWIMTPEERRARKIKIEENRKRKSLLKVVECDSTVSSFELNEESNDMFLSQRSNFEGFSSNRYRFMEIPNHIYLKTVELEMSANPMIRPLTDLFKDFNETELKRISEVQKAVQKAIQLPFKNITNDFQREVINAFQKTTITGDDISKLMAIYNEQMVQKTIIFSKGLNSFNILCENDQIALIKYGCFQICFLRSVRYFNFEHQYWTLFMDNEISFIFKLDLLKNHEMNTYFDHKNFLTKIGSEWDSDDCIIDLLTAIVLFNPDRPTIEHKEMIRFQQQIYMYLLQRYLFLKYGSECKAMTKFIRLMNSLTDLYAMDDKIVKNWQKTDPNRSMPLMSEICDRFNP